MIIFALIATLFLIIISICLPQILSLILVAFAGYIICKTLKRKSMGQMIILLCIFVGINIIMTEINPVIKKVYHTKEELKNSIKSVEEIKDTKKTIPKTTQEKIEQKFENVSDNPIWKFLNKKPKED